MKGGKSRMDLDLTTPEGRKKQGELILQAIREAGLSVEQVAKDIGCSRALLYQYIAGTTLAQPDKLTLIARRTGKPLVFFYGADLAQPEAIQAEREAFQRERLELERKLVEERERNLKQQIENLFSLADAQSSPPDWKSAASTCEQIIPLARSIGDEESEAKALFKLGNLRLLMGDIDGALSSLRQAQSLFEKLENKAYALACRQSIGRALLLMGHPEEAKAQFDLAAKSDNWHNRWEATVALAAVSEWVGDFKSAMERLDEAEDLSSQAPTEREGQIVRMFVSANRANVYLACGDFAEAEKLAREALKVAEQIGDRDQQLELMLTIAVCLGHLGKWVEAYESALRAKTLASFANDFERVVVAETVLAQLLAIVGDFDGAKVEAKSALTSALKIRSRRAELWAQKALAETYLREGNSTEARYHAQMSFEIAEGMRHALEHAHSLALKSWTNFQLGDLNSANEEAEKAFHIADEKGMRYIAALSAWLKAQIAMKRNEKEAEKWLSNALKLAQETGDANLLYSCLALKGEWSLLKGKLQEAFDALMKAHHLLESWRTDWRNFGLDDTWLEDPFRRKAYLSLAQCIAQKEGKEAAEKFVNELGWLPLIEDWHEIAASLQLHQKTEELKRRK
ncbi:MAG: tetratricopeptide repeat protein [Armatimonadota bacterium]|nr:tetratricopeptide repeat protein [Armatimonadota bacterium]